MASSDPAPRRVLVTGATGTVGSAVMERLCGERVDLVAGVRDPEAARRLSSLEGAVLEAVDFETGVVPDRRFDAVFLVRPPHLGDPAVFEPFLDALHPDTHVVFLSVQGAERRGYLPHAKLEERIRDRGLGHTFLRPAYFMENLTTTLWPELERARRIWLPAGRLGFDWGSVQDVAELAARALLAPMDETALEVSSGARMGFADVIQQINDACGTELRYVSPWMPWFAIRSLWRGRSLSWVGVMLLLHWLPRYTREHPMAPCAFEQLTGKPMQTLAEFVASHRGKFESLRSPAGG